MQRKIRQALFFFLVVALVWAVVLSLHVAASSIPVTLLVSKQHNYMRKDFYLKEFNRSSGALSSECTLPEVNPWSPEIMPYTDLFFDKYYYYTCTTPKELSWMENGTLQATEGYSCQGRCILRKNEFQQNLGPWKGANESFDCDLIHTKCSTVTSIKPYESVITQVYEKPLPNPQPVQNHTAYNVYIILVDSTGYSQAKRNLPKSLYFLEHRLEIVEFPYATKLGKNSYPNAIPLWFGKSVEDVDKSIYGENVTPSEWPQCGRNPDHYRSIMQDFKAAGYATLLAEDWNINTVVYPDCNPDIKQLADHVLQPLRYYSLHNDISQKNSDYCKGFKKDLYDGIRYMSQFYKSYKDQPKFGWFWLSYGFHEWEEESVGMDSDIFKFLIDNQKELDQSFVFFMADHGLRFGTKMDTKHGILDDNNPYLSISLPKDLRGSVLHEQMKENSKRMQTHYDTRATWLDIAKFQANSNWTNTTEMQIDEEKGQSLLRKQPGERNYYTLPIPFQYCICDYKMQEIDNTSSIANTLSNFVINHIHSELVENNVTDRCGFWEFKRMHVEAYAPLEQTGVFQISLWLQQKSVDNAKFKAFLKLDKTQKVQLLFITREDRYENKGDCVYDYKRGLDDFCNCL